MGDVVIRAEALSKRYDVARGRATGNPYQTFAEVLARRVSVAFAPFHRHGVAADDQHGQTESFWALHDVSFDVERGQRVGIIGGNGAGKSTLLKILSRITVPTGGSARIHGRVASLLEVGTGFHPELTGRENIYLNGAILGLSRRDVCARLEEIVEFADIAEFVDMPVKRYSSGMYVRTAFSVAAHLAPDILILDEVLAVGDAQFQKKCVGKIDDIGSSGRTVLFVSHNMALVQKVCNQALWISAGKISSAGEVASVVAQYEASVSALSKNGSSTSGNLYCNTGISEGLFGVTEISMIDALGRPLSAVRTLDDCSIRISFQSPKFYRNAGVEIFVSTPSGVNAMRMSTRPDGCFDMQFTAGRNEVTCSIQGLPLSAGTYVIGIGLSVPMREWLFLESNLCALNVEPNDVFDNGFPPRIERSVAFARYSWQASDTPVNVCGSE